MFYFIFIYILRIVTWKGNYISEVWQLKLGSRIKITEWIFEFIIGRVL